MRYTVVGVYIDPLGQRFGTTVEAETPMQAEIEAKKEADDGMLVAAVFVGELSPVDVYTDGYSFGVPS